jgi:hypothetical protein
MLKLIKRADTVRGASVCGVALEIAINPLRIIRHFDTPAAGAIRALLPSGILWSRMFTLNHVDAEDKRHH